MTKTTLNDDLDPSYRQGLNDDLCRLIRIPSRSSQSGGEEGPVQALVLQRLREEGARVRAFEADAVPGFKTHPLCHGPERDYRLRPTVIGEIGPDNAPALMVLAHSDTVQIARPHDWTFDPFVGDVRDGKIRGLGAADDKWGVATLLTILRALRDSGRPLRKRIMFVSTVDEENGVGNGLLLLMLAGIRADAALYLDGAAMQVCTGNLGGSNLMIRPRLPLDADRMARDAGRLQAACRERSRQRLALFDRAYYRDNLIRERSVLFNEAADAQGRYFDIGFFTFPEEDRATSARMVELLVDRALGPDAAQYALRYWEPWFDPTLLAPETPLIRQVASAVSDRLKREPAITTISKQDSFIFNKYAGIPTVSFGPGHLVGGGVRHQPDEHLSVDDAWNGARVAYSAVCRWLESACAKHRRARSATGAA